MQDGPVSRRLALHEQDLAGVWIASLRLLGAFLAINLAGAEGPRAGGPATPANRGPVFEKPLTQ